MASEMLRPSRSVNIGGAIGFQGTNPASRAESNLVEWLALYASPELTLLLSGIDKAAY